MEAMEEKEPGWKKKHNSKVVERRSRQVYQVKWKEFTGLDGAYTEAMKKMISHKQDVILLGKKMNSNPRHQYVRSRRGKAVLLTVIQLIGPWKRQKKSQKKTVGLSMG